jgi:hypothetical protein
MRARRCFLVALSSLAAAAGLQAQPGTFQPKRAADYPSHQTIGKLTVAAVKYESDTETHSAFGKVNPNEYGALPVYLIMDNAGDQTLLLSRMRVSYQVRGKEDVVPMKPEDLPYLIAPKRPGTGVKYPIPVPLPKKKNPLAAEELQTRAFSAKTILAHDKAAGFLYFETRHQREAVLYITGIREGASGKELFYLEVPIDTP